MSLYVRRKEMEPPNASTGSVSWLAPFIVIKMLAMRKDHTKVAALSFLFCLSPKTDSKERLYNQISYLNITYHLGFLPSLHCQSFQSEWTEIFSPHMARFSFFFLEKCPFILFALHDSHQHPSHHSSAVHCPWAVAQPDPICSRLSAINSPAQPIRAIRFQVFQPQAEGEKQTEDSKLCKASSQFTSMTRYKDMPKWQYSKSHV